MTEASLAWQYEEQHTKEEILEQYLNTVYFGANACGAEAAAHTYFDKSATQLNGGTHMEPYLLERVTREQDGEEATVEKREPQGTEVLTRDQVAVTQRLPKRYAVWSSGELRDATGTLTPR